MKFFLSFEQLNSPGWVSKRVLFNSPLVGPRLTGGPDWLPHTRLLSTVQGASRDDGSCLRGSYRPGGARGHSLMESHCSDSNIILANQ